MNGLHDAPLNGDQKTLNCDNGRLAENPAPEERLNLSNGNGIAQAKRPQLHVSMKHIRCKTFTEAAG